MSVERKIGCKIASCFVLLLVMLVSCKNSPMSREETDIGDTEVWIEDSKFKPYHKYVNLGQKVTWVNKDPIPHTVTSGLPEESPGQIFSSGVIRPGETFSVNFPEKDRAYKYHCRIHELNPSNPPILRVRKLYQK